MNITEYFDPFEYPDWRWSRIKALLTESVQPTMHDDKYVHRGLRFAKALETCDGSDTARYSVTLQYRDLAKAVGLHNNASNRKYFLEALVLCPDVGEDTIAAYMGESQHTVRYYGKLFYDVREKLDSPGYLCARILEPAVVKALEDYKEPNIAWKLAAIFGGFEVVKACWELKESAPKVRNYYRGAGMSALFKDFGVGTHLRPVNKWNTEHIADHVIKFAEIEVKNQMVMGHRQSEEKVEMLKEIMSSIKFFVADPNAPVNPREPRLYEKADQALVAAVTGE